MPITSFMKTSPTIGPNTPVIPPSTSTALPNHLQLNLNLQAGDQAQVEVITVSSGQKDGSFSGTKRAAPEESKNKEEAEVTSAENAEAPANDALTFPKNFGGPTDLYATPKSYATKFCHKLT
jgi:hypothetical protein